MGWQNVTAWQRMRATVLKSIQTNIRRVELIVGGILLLDGVALAIAVGAYSRQHNRPPGGHL